jgi:hypothetical protein
MFDMEAERSVTLRGGRFDGKTVEIDPKATVVGANINIYNNPRAVKAGAMRRSESMVAYRVIDGSDIAECMESGSTVMD